VILYSASDSYDRSIRRENRRAWLRTVSAIAIGGFLAIFLGTLGASLAIDALVSRCAWPGMVCEQSVPIDPSAFEPGAAKAVIPGSKRSAWKKKLDGTVVPR
jgi:hypothetical protein